jgi:hypothetical protein
MNALPFAVPFQGGCLSPSREPQPPGFAKGDRVFWQDGDEGCVVELTAWAICIRWADPEYGVCW